MKTPDYMSYTRYKKKRKNTSKKVLLIFIATFCVTLLFLVVMARSLSSNVDVSIGEDVDMEAKETGLGVKGFIDDRLKMIQMEDRGSATLEQREKERKVAGYNDESFDNFSRELDEKVVIPRQKKVVEESDSIELEPQVVTPPRPRPLKDVSTPFESSSAKSVKVFVGYYYTVEQARVAQGILLDSGLNITPFVKNTGDSYTLQVGSYSSRAKAESLASELLRNNFPARIVQE